MSWSVLTDWIDRVRASNGRQRRCVAGNLANAVFGKSIVAISRLTCLRLTTIKFYNKLNNWHKKLLKKAAQTDRFEMSVIVSKLTQQLAAGEVLALGRYRAAQTHSDVCFVQSLEFTHAHTHVAVAVSNAVDV